MVLSENDRKLVAAIQDGLPLVPHPYAVLAETLGTTEADIIERLQRLQDDGMVKRMGVVVKHRALGYHANAMVVWDVPDSAIQQVGELLAAQECITLCYQRPRCLPDWPYNLFCMIHGHERKAVLRRLAQIIDANSLGDIPHEVLFSLRSFKQRGARYAARPARTAHG
ncbi:MAG: AsnC family protein [Gammaproteobacteria bacterium]|nr:MAG: AsnC family protein [Gammaproteobacteria bacterium]